MFAPVARGCASILVTLRNDGMNLVAGLRTHEWTCQRIAFPCTRHSGWFQTRFDSFTVAGAVPVLHRLPVSLSGRTAFEHQQGGPYCTGSRITREMKCHRNGMRQRRRSGIFGTCADPGTALDVSNSHFGIECRLVLRGAYDESSISGQVWRAPKASARREAGIRRTSLLREVAGLRLAPHRQPTEFKAAKMRSAAWRSSNG